jgi:P27 family predicted phage terminase small subunit
LGDRGPAPKPTALRVLHGDRKSRVNLDEPQPRNLSPAKPEWLSESAGELWDLLMPDLEVMGTVKCSDWVALAQLCETWSRWRRINDLVAKSPPIWKRGEDAAGNPIMVKNPLYSQVRDASAELRVMLREFGLTPSARAGLRVEVVLNEAADRLFTRSA